MYSYDTAAVCSYFYRKGRCVQVYVDARAADRFGVASWVFLPGCIVWWLADYVVGRGADLIRR